MSKEDGHKNRAKKNDWITSSNYKGQCMKQMNGKFIAVSCKKGINMTMCQTPKLGNTYSNKNTDIVKQNAL